VSQKELLPKKGCRIQKRRLYTPCNTGDPGLEDVVGPESNWDSLHRLRLFLNVQETSVDCSWDGRKLVLTFRGARALPEVTVKVLGFKG
jgi:hypothetical protein